MSRAKMKSTQRLSRLKKNAKRLAAYSAAAAATVVTTENRPANADPVHWDIPDVTVGPATFDGVVFNMVLGTAFRTVVGGGFYTSGAMRLVGAYSTYPNPYLYTRSFSYNGRFVGSATSNASLLGDGAPIGPSQNFVGTYDPGYLNYGYYANLGDWSVGQRGFVGFRFDLDVNTHYGWADITREIGLQATLHAFGYNDTPDAISFAGEGAPSGDFNGDGAWDCTDIDALTAAVASGSTDTAFDMNGDGQITDGDITDAGVGWLAVGGEQNPGATGGNAFLVGDADLNGAVDVSDFNVWNANKFSNVAEWCSGDFNASGGVDVSDFNVWNANKFQSSDSIAAVPEPHGLMLLAAGAAGLGMWRRKRRSGKAA